MARRDRKSYRLWLYDEAQGENIWGMAVTPGKMMLWLVLLVLVPFCLGIGLVYSIMKNQNEAAAQLHHEQLMQCTRQIDSLAVRVRQQDLYWENLQQVMTGDIPFDTTALDLTALKHQKVELMKASDEEIRLREQVHAQEQNKETN
ncbi:MAG: hypothetical protein MJZ73_07310 [Bacteroidaceae bacterium]|nr:hypothetical protein [Bacteroidaceae bacterium]